MQIKKAIESKSLLLKKWHFIHTNVLGVKEKNPLIIHSRVPIIIIIILKYKGWE